MRVTFCPPHLIENKVAGNFQEPGRELRPRDVATGASPNANKNLLGDIFDIGVAAKHSGNCARDKRLVSPNQPLKRDRIAARY
jgi:hypothetical protein